MTTARQSGSRRTRPGSAASRRRTAFAESVKAWERAAESAARARGTADGAEARALLAATGPNADARRAQALIASEAERLAFALANINARARFHEMVYLRGSGAPSEGDNPGDADPEPTTPP